MKYIVLAIPAFILLIGLELVISKLKKSNLYRLNDTVTNISCGIGQQVLGIFLKTLLFLGYVYIFEASPFKGYIPNEWWVWVILFIGVDFFYYWFHRLAHEISIMWGSHVVHHQSEEYNLSVALRQGWIQSIFSFAFYLPLAIAGFPPVMFIAVNAFQTLYQFWIHTRTIDKLPRPFEYVFNTPSHHRVHHGVNPRYIDRNHGGTLIIFDRMFGTFQEEEEEVVYGITKQPKSWNPLWLNFAYWIEIFRDAGRAAKWSDKFKILLMPPGWKPEDLGGVEEAREVTPDTFNKFDTTIPTGLNYYVLFQYILILAGSTAFLYIVDSEPYNSNILFKVGLAVLIFVSLINLGGIFEMKNWVKWTEYIRVIAIAFAMAYLFSSHNWGGIFSALSIIGGLISIVWFARFHNIFTIPVFISKKWT